MQKPNHVEDAPLIPDEEEQEEYYEIENEPHDDVDATRDFLQSQKTEFHI